VSATFLSAPLVAVVASRDFFDSREVEVAAAAASAGVLASGALVKAE
jgi:hypothetical protein